MHALEANAAFGEFRKRSGAGIYRRNASLLKQNARGIIGVSDGAGRRKQCESDSEGRKSFNHIRLLD
jgi:hypothetical protein